MTQIKREDYEEPRCLLIDPATGESGSAPAFAVPMMRVIDKLEEYCGREDYEGAERHLKYWLDEAIASGDIRGQFGVENERMGYYRKQGRKDEAIACAASALELMEKCGYADTISGGTCLVNCGTVYDAFEMPVEALEYFERAREIYESSPHREWEKIGGLYNNMALTLTDLARFDEAAECYEKAIKAMDHVKYGELEQAISLLNMADLIAARDGMEASQDQIRSCLGRAKKLLETQGIPRNGYYAFVLEKCAPVFYCYGDDEYGALIEERYKGIYEENRRNS